MLPYYEYAVEKYLTEPFWAYYGNYGNVYIHNWKDYYKGEFESEEDFAKFYMNNFILPDNMDVPPIIICNIDYSMVWEDLRHDYTFIDGFVFRN